MEEILDQSNQFNEENGMPLEALGDRMQNLPQFNMGSYFSKAGGIYTKILGASIGFAFLSVICIVIVALFFGMILGLIQGVLSFSGASQVELFSQGLVESVVNEVLFSGAFVLPFLLGYSIYLAKALKGKDFSFDDMFKGFKRTKEIFLANLGSYLIYSLPVMVLAIVILGLATVSPVQDIMNQLKGGQINNVDFTATVAGSGLVLMIIGTVIGMMSLNIFNFVLFREVTVIEAIKYAAVLGLKKFFPYLFMSIVAGFILLVSAMFFGIGLLFTLPIVATLYIAAFDHLVGIDSTRLTFD